MEPDTADWVRRTDADLDNIRAAIALALAGGTDPILAVKFAVTMTPYWLLRGYLPRGAASSAPRWHCRRCKPRIWCSRMRTTLVPCSPTAKRDHAEARRMLENCLELHRKLGNQVDVAATLSTLSLARLKAGDAIAAAASEREALAMFRALGEAEGEAIGLLHLGQIAIYLGDTAGAG